jgi:cephalosporin hydroxylase
MLEQLLIRLGLNDEGLDELPVALHPHCGRGLLLWQYPNQFSRYLLFLSQLGVRSYLEVGLRHGGSFVTTIEYLNRFAPLAHALGVDVIPAPSLERYLDINPRATLVWMNSQTPAFEALLVERGPFDLAFIDSHHEEDQCRHEFELLRRHTRMVGMHDIVNMDCPGVRSVWAEVKASGEYICYEFTDQYPGLGPFMGIGLAVERTLLSERTILGQPTP